MSNFYENFLVILLLCVALYMYNTDTVLGLALPVIIFGSTLSMKHDSRMRTLYQYTALLLTVLLIYRMVRNCRKSKN